jgi:hypothetical protein
MHETNPRTSFQIGGLDAAGVAAPVPVTEAPDQCSRLEGTGQRFAGQRLVGSHPRDVSRTTRLDAMKDHTGCTSIFNMRKHEEHTG